jgi:hypothetical protein
MKMGHRKRLVAGSQPAASSNSSLDGDSSTDSPSSYDKPSVQMSEKQSSSLAFGNSLESADDSKDADLDEQAQAVMKSNLDLMLEVVMQIREDESFASSIYEDCPRLQHLLSEHPDLRPIFQDPHLVRINFEQVYRDAGGVLPEDPPPKKPGRLRTAVTKVITKIVSHPLFKVVKFLMLIKKVVGFILSGGVSLLMGLLRGLLGGWCCGESLDCLDAAGDVDGADSPGEGSPQNQANRQALNKAADHMEDPEVQERMQAILGETDPDALEEAIENDKELKALRDSNPLCAELMSDPETMKILTDPDNLRALGDAPDLIEQDFANPDWVAPDDVEARGAMETVPEEWDVDDGGEYDVDDAKDHELEVDQESQHVSSPSELDPEIEENELQQQELELEEADVEGDEEGGLVEDFEMGEAEGNDNAANKSRSAGNKKAQAQKKKQPDKPEGSGGGVGGFFANLGAGITDYVAGELVGTGMGELFGDGDEIGDMENFQDLEDAAPTEEVPVDGIADAAESGASTAENAAGLASTADVLLESDNFDNLEDGMDTLEDKHDAAVERDSARAAAGNAAAGGAVVGGGMAGTEVVKDRSTSADEQDEDEDNTPKKKNRFGFVAGGLSAIATAAKEHIATAVIGDDLGEMLVEKLEEDEDEEDQDSKDGPDQELHKDNKASKNVDDSVPTGAREKAEAKSYRRFFRRGHK